MCAESVAHVSPHVRGSVLGGRFILWGVVQMWHKRNHYKNQVKNMHFCHDVMILVSQWLKIMHQLLRCLLVLEKSLQYM